MKYKKRILIIVNEDWVFLLHRISIANFFKKNGFDVIVVAKDTGKGKEILRNNFGFVNINFKRKGTNPFYELHTFIEIYKLCYTIKPELIYQVTIKPVLYGGLASKFLKIKNVNTICGLGYVYLVNKNTILKKIVSLSYKFLLNSNKVFTVFENKDDRNFFLMNKILCNDNNSTVANGAGVNLNVFDVNRYKKKVNEKLTFVLPCRMLWSKGVKEFVEAALKLKERYYERCKFMLYGMIDNDNPDSIPEAYLNNIKIDNYLKWYGFTNDMISVYLNADVVVLPSYYGEGLPTVLAEACAMGLPIITTNSVGCRDCVDEGENGFKVPVKSVEELSMAMEKLICDTSLRVEMGKASRTKAEKEFDEKKILIKYAKALDVLVKE